MSPYMEHVYWGLFGAALALAWVALAASARGAVDRRDLGPWALALVPAALAILVVAGRWPSVLIPIQLNPDEGLMIAQAMLLSGDPLPWRGADHGTGGPVNSYVLLVASWLGVPLGYPGARVAAIACAMFVVVMTWVAGRRLAGAFAGTMSALPTAVFFAYGTGPDFIHYSSEMASVAAIALLAYLASRLSPHHDTQRGLCVAIGVAAAIVALSKLQGVLLGAAISVSIVACTSPGVRTLLLRIGFIALGGGAAMALLVLALWLGGALDAFVVSFFEMPRIYASSPFDLRGTLGLVERRQESAVLVQAALWLLPATLLLAPALASGRKFSPGAAAIRLGAFALILLALYLTLSRPGRTFPHYTIYAALALPWLLLMLTPWRAAASAADGSRGSPAWLRALAVLGLSGVALWTTATMWSDRADRDWESAPAWPFHEPARNHWYYQAFEFLDREGARKGLWGWAAQAWVYTRIPPATRETSTEFVWRGWGRDDYYRRRYMDGLQASLPEYYTIAVGPSHFMFVDREKQGVDTVPGLSGLLEESYTVALDDGDTALLIRNDVHDRCCAKPAALDPEASDGRGWQFDAARPIDLLAIPMRRHPASDAPPGAVHVIADGEVLHRCAPEHAPASGPLFGVCVLRSPQGSRFRVVDALEATGDDAPTVEIGPPLVIFR